MLQRGPPVRLSAWSPLPVAMSHGITWCSYARSSSIMCLCSTDVWWRCPAVCSRGAWWMCGGGVWRLPRGCEWVGWMEPGRHFFEPAASANVVGERGGLKVGGRRSGMARPTLHPVSSCWGSEGTEHPSPTLNTFAVSSCTCRMPPALHEAQLEPSCAWLQCLDQPASPAFIVHRLRVWCTYRSRVQGPHRASGLSSPPGFHFSPSRHGLG